MKDLIKELEGLKTHHERMRGSQRLGLGSSFWDGRAQGVQDAAEVVRKYLQNNLLKHENNA